MDAVDRNGTECGVPAAGRIEVDPPEPCRSHAGDLRSVTGLTDDTCLGRRKPDGASMGTS